jgi:leucyl aminopeptidase (aminopeptidase T)
VINIDGYRFPPFDLVRLLRTVFRLEARESFGVFTDLPDPRAAEGFAYLGHPGIESQKLAFSVLYSGLLSSKLGDASFYAYRETGGSNLDLPDAVVTPEGKTLPLREALSKHSISLFMGRYSATAPATALAKQMGFRGATMHGTNAKVLATGLSVDYEEVSARAERLREALTRADSARMQWGVGGRTVALDIALGRQEAQKSHGLVRTKGDIANLPAGEVYFVPKGAEGVMPMKFEDEAGTIALFRVKGRGIVALEELVQGDRGEVDRFLEVVRFDPSAGQITELGLGTQSLPWAGTDIQDEKILGTAHLATGRSDHLGGEIGPKDFREKRNAVHNDVLYTPVKTPEIDLSLVTVTRGGETIPVVEHFAPSEFVERLI